jgi:NADH-quinone oxidoreductase subunit G
LTVEDAYAYAKFARVVCGTNDIDFRARPHSVEEQDFLAAQVAGRHLDVTYEDLERAPAVLLVGFEPEEESPIVYLRLRKAVRAGTAVFSVAALTSPGLRKLAGRLLRVPPTGEPAVLDALSGGSGALDETGRAAAAGLRQPGAIILAGERLAGIPGALSAVARLAAATSSRLAWIPRRAGDRGAVEAGALPNLLPGGRVVIDAAARAAVTAVWGAEPPPRVGRSTTEILTAARDGDIDVLVVAGVSVDDLPDPALAEAALTAVPFVISLELRRSFVTERADVVFPIAPAVEKAGAFVNWEGRVRPFDATLEATGALADGRVLHTLAGELGHDLGLATHLSARDELRRLGANDGTRAAAPSTPAAPAREPRPGEAILASWHLLLDDGRLQDGEPFLAGTRRAPRALLSATTAAEVGVREGGLLRVGTDRGGIILPLAVADLPDRVVWLPSYSPGSHVARDLGVDAGAIVSIGSGGSA